MNIETIYQKFLECSSVCIDTRKISKNTMFFALKGDNFNGNTFAKQALENGAKWAIIDDKSYAHINGTILVENTLNTLQLLATHHRKTLNIPIIALTGSNGKTTTKELINSVLSTQYNTTATIGNLNNHIGVPLTLLAMNKTTEIGIVEMGANHKKEIETLCNIVLPDYGLITNFGKAHLEGFGGFEGVIQGKSEMYVHLKTHHKTIFANTDDDLQLKQIGHYNKIFSFGNKQSDVYLTFLEAKPNVRIKYQNQILTSNLTGTYNFTNIAYSVAVGAYFKISKENIKKAIKSYIPKNNRSQIINKGTSEIILDAYNANPTSMKAALSNFFKYDNDKKVLILGDMFELGTSSKEEHQKIVDYISEHFQGKTFLVGMHFFQTKTNRSFLKFKSFESLKDGINLNLDNTLVLIKGSRGMALERVLEII